MKNYKTKVCRICGRELLVKKWSGKFEVKI